METTRDRILALSYRCNGNWSDLLKLIKEHTTVTKEDVNQCYASSKAQFITLGESNYPNDIKIAPYPSIILYYYGNLDLLNAKYRLAAVGSRQSTSYQLEKSKDFIKDAEDHFNNNLVLISGMAKGMDQNCMKVAMECDAPIIAVLGSGIDNPYPSDNSGVYNYCKSGKGLVISEYPAKVEGCKERFLFRNRLIACLSPVIYVGSGSIRGGTSSIVKYGVDMNKEIAALPCDEIEPTINNAVIKDGATSILCSKDLINLLEDRFSNL